MNVVDSSGWLAYFSDAANANHFAEPLADSTKLVVPVITLYEVFKVVLRESSEHNALQAVAAMQRGTVVNLTPELSLSAARYSLKHNLPMADSIILATTRLHKAILWTQDAHFKDINKVKYFAG